MRFIRQVTTAQSSIITELSNEFSMIKQRCFTPEGAEVVDCGIIKLCCFPAMCHARSAASFRFDGFQPHPASYYDVNKSLNGSYYALLQSLDFVLGVY